MKLLKNKIFVGVLCMAIGVIAAFVLVPRNDNTGETVKVIKVSKTVSENTQLTESMLKEVEVGVNDVPNNAITDKNAVIGKYAKVTLYDTDYITEEKLSTLETESSLYALNIGERAVSVTPKTLAKSVSGNLLIGDVVQLYGYDTQDNKLNPDSGKWNFEVLAIDNSKSENVSGVSLDNASDIVPAAITLKATSEEQVQSIVYMENNNDVQVVFVARGENAALILGE